MNLLNMLRNEKNVVELPAGTVLFRKGDPCDSMYVVLEGAVAIKVGDTLIETIPPGGIFGEMALIDGAPRSADAVAEAHTQLAEINEQRFMQLAQYNPYFTLEVLRITVARLRNRIQTNA